MIPQSFGVAGFSPGVPPLTGGNDDNDVDGRESGMFVEREQERWNDGTPAPLMDGGGGGGTWPSSNGAMLQSGFSQGTRFGREWQDAVFTAEDILQNDPAYQFLVQVAGATNGRVEDLLNMDVIDQVVSKANESASVATRLLKKLRENWEIFDGFDEVMIDFGTDPSGAAFIRDVIINQTMQVVTGRLVESMIESRKLYSKTLGTIGITGAIEIGNGAQDVSEFHQSAGILVDATHWIMEADHELGKGVYEQDDQIGRSSDDFGGFNGGGGRDDFESMHRRVVEALVGNDHFAATTFETLRVVDPQLVPAFFRVIIHGASGTRRELDRYRVLTKQDSGASIRVGKRKGSEEGVVIDPYLFLMTVLDMSWQVVLTMGNRDGMLRTNPSAPWQVLILDDGGGDGGTREGGSGEEMEAYIEEEEEEDMTPKQVWYQWFTEILERISNETRTSRRSLSDIIQTAVINVSGDGAGGGGEEGNDDTNVQYPFQKLHSLANQYNVDSETKRDVDNRGTLRLRTIQNKLEDIDRTSIEFEVERDYLAWLEKDRRREKVLYPITTNLKKLLELFPDPQSPPAFSPRLSTTKREFKDEGKEEEEEEEEEFALARRRGVGFSFIGVSIGEQRHRRHQHRQGRPGVMGYQPHFVSSLAPELDRLIRVLRQIVTNFTRLRNTHRQMRVGMESILREVLRDPRGRIGGAGQVDPEWILNPRFTGRVTMSPPMVAGINSAINEIRQWLPRLAPRSISDPMVIHTTLSTTPFLSQIYAELVALNIQQSATLFPRQVFLDKTYERGRNARIGVLSQLSSWIWGNPPYDMGERNAAARGRDRGRMSGTHLDFGGITVASMPPPVHPSDSRFKREKPYRPSTIHLNQEEGASKAYGFPPSGSREGKEGEEENPFSSKPKRRRLSTLPVSSDFGVRAITTMPHSEGTGDIKDVARHIVHQWDESYIRQRILDNLRLGTGQKKNQI